jgi:GNAT superfamily N-acetyltransferase
MGYGMITIKRLSQCTLEEALTAWNKGFEGYYFDMTLSLESFFNRMVLENLSPALSVVAFHDSKPVGLVLNGIRTIDGKKIAWNGGTGVAPEYRSKGVGVKLMEEVLSLYEKENVDTATLEAVSHNDRAIKLYEKMGYQVVDRIAHLGLSAPLKFKEPTGGFRVQVKKVRDVQDVSFYNKLMPWQVQWQNIRDGESIHALDEKGETIGFALSKRKYDDDGTLSGILLFQCEAHPEHQEKEAVLRTLLHEAFAFSYTEEIHRTAVNLSKSNQLVHEILEKVGFIEKAEQVFMIKEMSA